MEDLAQAAALALAAVLAWAAVAKAREREATVRSFRGLGLPAPGALAVLVPSAEVAVAAGLVVAPSVASWPALALVAGFSIVIARAVAARSTVPCACFGGGSDRPVSVVELVRNAGLGGLAVIASGAGSGPALWPRPSAAVAVALAVAAAWAALRIARRD